ncbi:MAG: hypothetical protein IPL86_15855 [Flavobacteriales bacterium]|nr:hypothetical protein [Flavobacteriales bacterium]
MSLPKQVLDAAERADKAIAAIRAGNLKALVGEQIDDPSTEAPLDPSAVVQPKDTGREDWKARFLTLKGKYDAEVPRYAQDLRAANARNDDLLGENAILKAKVDELSKASPEPQKPNVTLEAAREVIGEEAAEAVRSITQHELAEIKRQVETTAATTRNIESERAADARTRFETSLGALVPDYREVDKRTDWREWLSQPDPFSGHQRQQLIVDAVNAADVNRVAMFFNAFKDIAGLAKKPAVEKDPLAHLQVPDNAGRVSTTGAQKRRWTRSEVTKAFTDIACGKYTEKEAAALNIEITAASREGRIIG